MKKTTGKGMKKVTITDKGRKQFITEMQKLRGTPELESDLTQITYSESRTVNTGNYENTKVMVSITTPVVHNRIVEALKLLKVFVQEEVNEQVEKINDSVVA